MHTDFTTFRDGFFALMDASERVRITAHLSPDDDSIGSVLALLHILKKRYPAKDIRIVYEGPRPDRYEPIASFDEISFAPDLAPLVDGADLLIVLDVNNLNRVSENPAALEAVPKRVCIDHHGSKPDAFDLSLIVPAFSSNSELVFRIFEDDARPIGKPLAEALLLGILGDTGGFSYVKPDQADVFPLAKELVLALGTSIDAFRAGYGGIPQEIIPLLKAFMANASYETIDGWPPFQYTFVDREAIRQGGFSDEDVSVASHIYMGQYLKSVKGYSWGFVMTPRYNGSCRISLRSLPGSVNVRDMMERMGVGGGHDRASGGTFMKEAADACDAKECIAKVAEWMKTNKPAIV